MKKIILATFLVAAATAILCYGVLFPAAALAEESDADEIARNLANPNTPLATLTLKTQYRGYDGTLPEASDQSNLSFLFQPSFPFPLGKAEAGRPLDQIFFRPAFPFVVDQPVYGAGGFEGETGFGDIGFDLAWGRNYPAGVLLVVGAVNSVPTGKEGLSSEMWGLGPEVFLGYFQQWGVLGFFPRHMWKVTGPEDRDMSVTSIQPAAAFMLGGGWVAGTAGELSCDWEAEQWTIPLQLNVSKTVVLGKLPVKLALEGNYYVEKADAFGPAWMVGLNISPVVPNIFAPM